MRLYHVSPTFLGNVVTFVPRGGSSEMDLPDRICTAPTIPQCILAMPTPDDWEDHKELHVYVTDSDDFVSGTEYDTEVTEEKWLLHPAILRHVGTLGEEFTWTYAPFFWGDDSGIIANCCPPELQIEFWRVKLRVIQHAFDQYDTLEQWMVTI